MTLLDPGSERAGDTMTDRSLLAAMVRVEDAWLVVRGHEPSGMAGEVPEDWVTEIATRAEEAGNPVVPLVGLLRTRLEAAGRNEASHAIHRGLTSQDVLDTALMLCAREALTDIERHVRRAIARLGDLARIHRDDLRAGRTLTQPAVPTTFGLTAASWLQGLLDTATQLTQLRQAMPVQLGGAAGTLAGPLTQRLGDPAGALARQLDLAIALPWHTSRAPVTRLGDALVELHDVCGHVAGDVLTASRPEIGELREGTGGGSSTMPHKHNPILSVLIHAASLAAPGYGATLHAAATAQVDQRADGGWHAEWPALAQLSRSAIATSSRTADLLDQLVVDGPRMRANAEAQASELLAEAGKLGAAADSPDAYLGATGTIVDAIVARATRFLEQS